MTFGFNPPSLDDRLAVSLNPFFQKAVSMEFGASMVEAREQQILDRVQSRQKQFVSRAQTSGRIQERPEDRAARAVARLMADRGIHF